MDKSKRAENKPKYMGFEFVFAGLLFLFNPNFGVLDVFPDVIGWALVLFGLYRLRDMAGELEVAAQAVLKLLYLGVAKAVLMLLVPRMEDAGYSLVFTFVFCVFETGLAMSMFTHLFEGYSYLALRYGGEGSVLGKRFSDYRLLTTAFLIIRAAFNLLPELRHLSTSDYTGVITATGIFDLQNYKTALYLADGLVAGAFGLAWLVMTIRFYRPVLSDRTFVENLRSFYNTDIATDTKKFNSRYISLAMIFMGVGFGCAFDIFLDGRNYVPDFLIPVFLLVGLKILGERYVSTKKTRLFCIPLFAVSLATWIYSNAFSEYYTYNVFKKFNTLYLLIGLVGLSVLECALFVLVIFGVRKILLHLIDNYCGVEDDLRFKRLTEEKNAMLHTLHRQLNIFTAVGCLVALSSALNYFCMFAYEEYWMVNTVVQIAFLFSVVWLFSSVSEQAKVRYKNL